MSDGDVVLVSLLILLAWLVFVSDKYITYERKHQCDNGEEVTKGWVFKHKVKQHVWAPVWFYPHDARNDKDPDNHVCIRCGEFRELKRSSDTFEPLLRGDKSLYGYKSISSFHTYLFVRVKETAEVPPVVEWAYQAPSTFVTVNHMVFLHLHGLDTPPELPEDEMVRYLRDIPDAWDTYQSERKSRETHVIDGGEYNTPRRQPVPESPSILAIDGHYIAPTDEQSLRRQLELNRARREEESRKAEEERQRQVEEAKKKQEEEFKKMEAERLRQEAAVKYVEDERLRQLANARRERPRPSAAPQRQQQQTSGWQPHVIPPTERKKKDVVRLDKENTEINKEE